MIGTLRGWARRMERALRPGGRGLILLYHRVAEERSDPYGLCVSPSDFEAHMSSLRSLGEPMGIAAMARAVLDRTLPERAIGVTFDDAYLDVLENAVPVLERHDIPATIFVTTGEAGRAREFWWDELERLLLQTSGLPGVLEVEVGGEARRWELAPDVRDGPDGVPDTGGWHILDERTPSRRHGAFRELYHLLRPLPHEARTRVLDELRTAVDAPDPPTRPSHRVMTPDQVRGVARGGLIDVGAHTRSHPDLPSLSPPQQRREVHRSRMELQAWIDRPVEGFAYPYGHHDARSVEEVRKAGFTFACSGDHRAVRAGIPLLLLPRVDVPPRETGPEELARRYLA